MVGFSLATQAFAVAQEEIDQRVASGERVLPTDLAVAAARISVDLDPRWDIHRQAARNLEKRREAGLLPPPIPAVIAARESAEQALVYQRQAAERLALSKR